MAKCGKCYSSNINTRKSKSRFLFYFLAAVFAYVSITGLTEGISFVAVGLGIALLLAFIGNRLVFIGHYCNNCRHKWSESSW
jgi:hypothetical protein